MLAKLINSTYPTKCKNGSQLFKTLNYIFTFYDDRWPEGN